MLPFNITGIKGNSRKPSLFPPLRSYKFMKFKKPKTCIIL